MADTMLGTDAYVAKLQAMGRYVARDAIAVALWEGADVLLEAEQSRAPVLAASVPGSSALPPGALKAGLRKARRQNPDNPDSPAVVVGPNSKTAHVWDFVENGHRSISRSGHAGRDVPAHPALRPAYEASIAATAEAVRESMRRQLAALEGGE